MSRLDSSAFISLVVFRKLCDCYTEIILFPLPAFLLPQDWQSSSCCASGFAGNDRKAKRV